MIASEKAEAAEAAQGQHQRSHAATFNGRKSQPKGGRQRPHADCKLYLAVACQTKGLPLEGWAAGAAEVEALEAAAAMAPATPAGRVGRHIGRIAVEVPTATSTSAVPTGGGVLLLELLIIAVVLPGLQYLF